MPTIEFELLCLMIPKIPIAKDYNVNCDDVMMEEFIWI